MIEVRKNKKGPAYRVKIYVDRRPVYSPFFSLKSVAEQWERKMLLQRDEERSYGVVSSSSITLKEFADKWMRERIRLSHAPSTQRNYETSLRLHILPTLGHKRLRDIRGADAAQVVDALIANWSTRTTNLVIGVLQSLMNDATEMRQIAANPLVGFKPLREELKEFRYWDKAEIQQFLNANRNTWFYPLFVAALNTGMRRGELCGLKWDRVNFPLRQLSVTRTWDRFGLKECTKSGKKRIVPMNEDVFRAIQPLWKDQRSEFVFCEEDGSPINVAHMDRHFRYARTRAGSSKIRFHDLRHSFASHFMMNKGSIYDLQKILGHSTVKMTERYAHLSPSHLDDAIKIVSFTADLRIDSPEIVPNRILVEATS